MRKLAKPSLDPGVVFSVCISRVRDRDLRKRLKAVLPRVTAAALRYEEAGTAGRLHTLKARRSVGARVSTAEMAAVYDNRMARRGSVGRPLYDRLQSAAPQGRCPLCGQRTVSTLDHYLPKAKFPVLAVVPANLVPACLDCNKAKLDAVATAAEDQTLHPYFDDVDRDSWLAAVIVEELPASLVFSVRRCASWDNITDARVRTHFKIFKLGELYGSHAAEELLNIRYQLCELGGAGGAVAVRTHLQEQAKSRAAHQVNSWQTAMYRALAASDWFCTGGYA